MRLWIKQRLRLSELMKNNLATLKKYSLTESLNEDVLSSPLNKIKDSHF